MKILLFLLLVVVSACSDSSTPERVWEVRHGMTKQEVIDLIGEPPHDTASKSWVYGEVTIWFEADTVSFRNFDGYYDPSNKAKNKH